MSRILCLVFALVLSACAAAPKQPVQLTAKQQVDKIIQVCSLLHSQHSTDSKYTDCQLKNNELRFSFLDQATYRGENQPVSQMIQTFCFAGQSSRQQTMDLYYSWQFRKESRVTRRKCPQVEFVRPAPGFSAPE